jgi:hypothetical protein
VHLPTGAPALVSGRRSPRAPHPGRALRRLDPRPPARCFPCCGSGHLLNFSSSPPFLLPPIGFSFAQHVKVRHTASRHTMQDSKRCGR